MTQSITPPNGAADFSAAVPTQRIVTSEVAVGRVRDRRGRFVTPDAPGAEQGRSEPSRPQAARSASGNPEGSQIGLAAAGRSESPPAGRSSTGRSRSADRAERAARARAERAAARAKAEFEAGAGAGVGAGAGTRPGAASADAGAAAAAAVEGPEHADPMEDRAKRFRAAVSELAADRQGVPGSSHGGPLVRARATHSTPGSDEASRPEDAQRVQPARRAERARQPESARQPERSRQPERAQRAERARQPERAQRRNDVPRPDNAPAEEHVRLRSPLADLTFDPLDFTVALPDLTAALGAIPGGLGAEVAESFVFAGQQWTSGDADAGGTPIGVQLAMEQRGNAPDAHQAASPYGDDTRYLGNDNEDTRYLGGEPDYLSPGGGRRRASV